MYWIRIYKDKKNMPSRNLDYKLSVYTYKMLRHYFNTPQDFLFSLFKVKDVKVLCQNIFSIQSVSRPPEKSLSVCVISCFEHIGILMFTDESCDECFPIISHIQHHDALLCGSITICAWNRCHTSHGQNLLDTSSAFGSISMSMLRAYSPTCTTQFIIC